MRYRERERKYNETWRKGERGTRFQSGGQGMVFREGGYRPVVALGCVRGGCG